MHKLEKFTVAILTLALAACADLSPTQTGTATGAGVGAGLGGLIGAVTGDGGGKRTATGAAIGAALGGAAGYFWSDRMQKQKAQMEAATQGTGVQVSQTPDNRLKLEIPSDISFDTGRADIKPNFRSILDQFAKTLTENPSTAINIIGHTDNTGTDAMNDKLSLQRAESTRNYLSARGVNSARVNIAGHGEREPIAANDTAANRAKNRRVEIFVAESAK